jgi:hypothetical protein
VIVDESGKVVSDVGETQMPTNQAVQPLYKDGKVYWMYNGREPGSKFRQEAQQVVYLCALDLRELDVDVSDTAPEKVYEDYVSPTIPVPDVIGLPVAEAERLLQDAGFITEKNEVTIDNNPNAGSVPVGCVFTTVIGVSHRRNGITFTERGAKITLLINEGKFDPVDADFTFRVHNVLEAEARQYLLTMGFDVQVEYQSAWSEAYIGKVMYTVAQSQIIDGKMYYNRGSTVTLVVGI